MSRERMSQDERDASRAQWTLIAFLSLFPLYFSLLGYFAFPSADDYVCGWMAAEKGVLQYSKEIYLAWSGRYFSTFIITVLGHVLDRIWLYQLYPGILIALLLASVFFFVRCVTTNDRRSALLVTLAFSSVYLCGLESLTQGFYWMTGSFSYQLPVSALFVLLGFIFRAMAERRPPGVLGHAFLAAVLVIVYGSTELIAAAAFMAQLAFLLHAHATRSPMRSWLFWIAAAAALLLAASFLAPGNSARRDSIVKAQFFEQLLFAAPRALIGAVQSLKWILVSGFIPMGVYLVGVVQPRKGSEAPSYGRARMAKAFWLFFGLTAFGLHFLVYWASGKGLHGRVSNTVYAVYCAYLFAAMLLFREDLVAWLRKWEGIKPWSYVLRRPALAMVLFLLAQYNVFMSAANLVNGSLFSYRADHLERMRILRQAAPTVQLPILTAKPFPVFFRDIDDRTQNRGWILESFMKYHGLEKVEFYRRDAGRS